MRFIQLLAILVMTTGIQAQKFTTLFESSGGRETPAYPEIIRWWQQLDAASGKVKMLTMGMTDAGFPLHLVVVSNHGDHNFSNIKGKKRVILINNGIHPGEPDGIDASMLLARDIVLNKYKIPDHIVLAIIPVYNIGGCLDRSTHYRVDQNGPEAFGFRGNSQNLDLNRDAIKCDSKDARAFTGIFHLADPDVFIDNHVSNGADYQHVMTLIATQQSKLGGTMGQYLSSSFEPGIYSLMKSKGYDLLPYVNSFGDTPENGWPEFWDSPRYLSGYAALWNTFSFVPESHMLKPYTERVKATYALMQSFIEFTGSHSATIKKLRDQAKEQVKTQEDFPLKWELDRSVFKTVLYKGYASGRKPSEVSGLPRLFYDRSMPFEKQVPVYNQYKVRSGVKKPKAYIIPQGWWKVVELLKINKVIMHQFAKDTVLEVEEMRIVDYKSDARQYEMHHPNSNVSISSSTVRASFRKGDWFVPMNQVANRFLVETLEPHAEDSYFAWNFFDAILGQKEGYSSYAFEDIAADYLRNNPSLQQKLEERRRSDTAFAKNGRAQLSFVYQHSPWYEPAHMKYPVYRLIR